MANSSGLSNVLGFAAVAAVAYFAWEYFIAPAVAQASTPAATPPATTSTTTTTTTTPPPASVAGCPTSSCPPTTDSIATQKSKILAAAGPTNGAISQTASVWNWYFNQAYGLPQSTTWLLGDDGSAMTVDSYLALRQSKGFSGFVLRGRGFGGSGLGRNYIPAATPMGPSLNYLRRGF